MFEIEIEIDDDGDRRKAYRTVRCQDGKDHCINHSPYEHISSEAELKLFEFIKLNGRPPEYGELAPGNHRNADLIAWNSK